MFLHPHKVGLVQLKTNGGFFFINSETEWRIIKGFSRRKITFYIMMGESSHRNSKIYNDHPFISLLSTFLCNRTVLVFHKLYK